MHCLHNKIVPGEQCKVLPIDDNPPHVVTWVVCFMRGFCVDNFDLESLLFLGAAMGGHLIGHVRKCWHGRRTAPAGERNVINTVSAAVGILLAVAFFAAK